MKDPDKDQDKAQDKEPDRTDTFGEVFTPPVLIEELLEHLPKSIWSNPDLAWLDPCAGTGNFMDCILPRLMEGLSTAFPQPAARKRHILTKMITMVELNPANVRVLRKKYGCGKSATILSGDFLDNKVIDDATATYDVILANPPYQTPKKTSYEGSVGNRTLWDLFIKKAWTLGKRSKMKDGQRATSLQQLSPQQTSFAGDSGSVLGFITPCNWRRPGHPLYQLLSNHLDYLHIYGKPAGMEHFHVQTRFDLYVVRVTDVVADSKRPIPLLVDEMGENHTKTIVPSEWPFLPNYMYKTIQSILVKNIDDSSGDGLPILYDSAMYDARKLTKRQTDKHKYPVIHTLTQKGIGFRYADHASKTQFGVPKVILNVNEKQYPVLDMSGKYGLSQLSFAIPIRTKTEGERILQCIESPVFQDILRATKWGSFQTDYRMFHYFRKDFTKILCNGGGKYTPKTKKKQTPQQNNRTKKYTKS
jgi:hypothetical protein